MAGTMNAIMIALLNSCALGQNLAQLFSQSHSRPSIYRYMLFICKYTYMYTYILYTARYIQGLGMSWAITRHGRVHYHNYMYLNLNPGYPVKAVFSSNNLLNLN